jgi:hypothetical protein
MSTYLGRLVVTMPSSPAPKSVEFSRVDIAGVSTSPFTGQQQIMDWQSGWLECQVTMPPMIAADAASWVTFLLAAKGVVNVFALANSTFAALVPSGQVAAGYWCLKSPGSKWSISEAILYGFEFTMREAI